MRRHSPAGVSASRQRRCDARVPGVLDWAGPGCSGSGASRFAYAGKRLIHPLAIYLARRRRLAPLLHLLSMLRVSWSNAAIGVVETVGGCRRARWRGRSPVATLMGVMPAARNEPQAGALTAGSGRCSRAAPRWYGPGFRFPAAHAGTPRRIAPCCRVPRRCLG